MHNIIGSQRHRCIRILTGTLICFLGLTLCRPTVTASQGFEVQVTRRAEYQDSSYCTTLDECRLCWQTHQSQINQGIVQSRSQCTKSLEDQMGSLRALLTEIVKRDPNGASLHTLFWGRLAPDKPQDDLQMSMRLALAAFQSDHWDRKRGKPVKGEIVYWVRDLANSAMIYPELQKLFKSLNRQIQVVSIEKVLVLPAGQMPFFDILKTHGVQKGDKLPYDCLTWFSIR